MIYLSNIYSDDNESVSPDSVVFTLCEVYFDRREHCCDVTGTFNKPYTGFPLSALVSENFKCG